jgi:hypothetical protein
MLYLRHTFPALYDILEWLILDVSLDLISGRKECTTKWLPSTEVQLSMKKIDQSTYRVTTLSTSSFQYISNYETQFVTYTFVDELCTLLHDWFCNSQLHKFRKNTTYVVDVQHGSCMYLHYLKHAYCKHLMHAHGHTHTHSNKFVQNCVGVKFTHQGNTSRARHECG